MFLGQHCQKQSRQKDHAERIEENRWHQIIMLDDDNKHHCRCEGKCQPDNDDYDESLNPSYGNPYLCPDRAGHGQLP